MLFDLACRLRWQLTKARNAPRVDAMYRASALRVISTGATLPQCVFRHPSPAVAAAGPASRHDVVLVTGNVKENKEGGCVISVNFDTGEIKTFATGLQSAFGIARFRSGYIVSDPKASHIWQIDMNGSASPFIGDGKQGSCDGVATECQLSVPLGVAVAGSTVFFVQGDGRVRLFSFTEQFCNFMASTREFGQLVGILDPRVRKDLDQRSKLRSHDFLHRIDTFDNIIRDREDWYKEARECLGLPPTAKGLKGPEGVPCYGTFQAWQASADDLRHVHTCLVSAGLSELAANIPLEKPNTMPVEHEFGHNALGHSHMETQLSYLPILNRSREETIASTCSSGFAHCTDVQPYVPVACQT